ncbi:ribosomal protein S6 kinase-related protein-like isoform X2 [Gigantopelta aegis]|uniref:ribosomal protein S6 kinase-related protein-like isoform X2 n=1 Tax=Gigantopelta aegis TaxID=1735272 RepID=UPI001B88CBA3|nr:ribosomal protein S6 kinase-related protein-like isoform X2 [Gigantopelta aegis]
MFGPDHLPGEVHLLRQSLSANETFARVKSRSSGRLFRLGSSPKVNDVDKEDGKTMWKIPITEALFLPDFPVRGDIEEQDFEVIDVIANGAYGNVLKVQREDEKQFYAMKVLEKEQIMKENAIQQCKDEASIQSIVGDHPFIVKLHEYWQSRTHLYMVLDYVPYGDLFSLWTFHTMFPERLVRLYVAEMAMVLEYLHNSGVIYRDLKMENILFDPKGHIQLIDFGLAKWLNRGERTRTICGTLQYMAPEVLSVNPYGHTADWWSLGILMYIMLAGKYPVEGTTTHTQMAQKVYECDFLLPHMIGNEPQDVVHRLLTKSPARRLTDLASLQNLDFFKNLIFTTLIEKQLSPMDVVPGDFFPMTGMSWAPVMVEKESSKAFTGFDGLNFRWNLPDDTVPVFV